MGNSQYNVLVMCAVMYGLIEGKRLLPMILLVIKDRKPSDEVLREIYAECRVREANPSVRKFYKDLQGLYDQV